MLLEVRKLRVKYGDFIAVDDLEFTVDREVFCLLGTNGAGKTTTLKAIMNMVPFEGEVIIDGLSNRVKEVKNRVGYVPEQPFLYEHMTPEEIINFVASIRGLKDLTRASRLVKALSLDNYMKEPIASLSMGNRQKVSVVLAMMHSPKLLILDEVFNGLDVLSTRILKELMLNHIKEGGGIVFSTHIMEIAEKVCNRVNIIKSGKLLLELTPEEIRDKGKSLEDLFLQVTGLEDEVKEILKGLE